MKKNIFFILYLMIIVLVFSSPLSYANAVHINVVKGGVYVPMVSQASCPATTYYGMWPDAFDLQVSVPSAVAGTQENFTSNCLGGYTGPGGQIQAVCSSTGTWTFNQTDNCQIALNANGSSCNQGTDCQSGYCVNWTCSAQPGGQGATCTDPQSCQSSFCNSLSVCSDRSMGAPCNSTTDCQSGICDTSDNVCTDGSVGSGCGGNSQCQSGDCSISDNVCVTPQVSCVTGADCSSGYCDTIDSICTNGSIGTSCGSGADCQSGACSLSTYSCIMPVAPTGTISINGGGSTTNSSTVTLTLTATDNGNPMGSNGNMQFSNDNVTWSTPVPFNTTQIWQLTNGNGPKTVYVMFQDSEGNWTSPYSANIYVGDPTLIANYQFNGDYTDASGNGNDGTAEGNTSLGSTSLGSGFATFDGADSYVQVPFVPALNLNAMTFSFWVQPNYSNYMNQTYTVLSKGVGSNTEYSFQFYGLPQGIGVLPLSVDLVNSNVKKTAASNSTKNKASFSFNICPAAPELSAPTNLVIQDGGLSSVTGQRTLYISWQDNTSGQANYVLEVGSSTNNLTAGTTSFKAYIDPTLTNINIILYAQSTCNTSVNVSAQVNLTSSPITVTTQYNTPQGFLPMDNKWHHVVRSWDPSGLTKYYIDGQLVYSAQSTAGPQGNDPLLIGAANPSTVVSSQTMLSTDGSTMTVSWSAAVGNNYQVQYSTDGQTWINLGGVVAGQGMTSIASDPSYQAGNSYQVVQLPNQVFNGGLSQIAIYNRVLSDTDVSNLYLSQKNNLRNIDNTFVVSNYCNGLSDPQLSACLDDMENQSQTFAPDWSINMPASINNTGEMVTYFQQKFQDQEQYYINAINLMAKYNALPNGMTASQLLAIYQPIWQADEANNAWGSSSGQSNAARTKASSSSSNSALSNKMASLIQKIKTNVVAQAGAKPAGSGSCPVTPSLCSATGSLTNYLSPTVPLPIYTSEGFSVPVPQLHAQTGEVGRSNLSIQSSPGTCSQPQDTLLGSEWDNLNIKERTRQNFLLFDGSNLNHVVMDYRLETTDGVTTNYYTNIFPSSFVDIDLKNNTTRVQNSVPGNAPLGINSYSDVINGNTNFCDGTNYSGYTVFSETNTVYQTMITQPLSSSDFTILSSNPTRVQIEAVIDSYTPDTAWGANMAEAMSYASWPFVGQHATGISGLTWSANPGQAIEYRLTSNTKLSAGVDVFTKKFHVEFNLINW